ncbi:Plant stearoyl-acyl-carrier-protein desaturase family protein [Perilla frutescens var. frutescens]|nr:Plant stearoyl-acyl-carrier-protein desaturase family protein [Perilla frutescens var. frutescens]UDV78675.1 stearoyl-acyl carrier protein desaturase 2.8 [Perilla frutescens]
MSFQERATFVSHSNTARLEKEGGDPILTKICRTIAADEKRHENAYIKIIEKLLEINPNEIMVVIEKMLRGKILIPTHLMYDDRDTHLFQHFTHMAYRIGVYTPDDYTDVLESLIRRWRLEKLQGLKGNDKCEQEFVWSLPRRIKTLKWHVCTFIDASFFNARIMESGMASATEQERQPPTFLPVQRAKPGSFDLSGLGVPEEGQRMINELMLMYENNVEEGNKNNLI